MNKSINYYGYDITIHYNKTTGLYELSTMVESMGEEYREHMTADELNTDTLKKFIEQIEAHK